MIHFIPSYFICLTGIWQRAAIKRKRSATLPLAARGVAALSTHRAIVEPYRRLWPAAQLPATSPAKPRTPRGPGDRRNSMIPAVPGPPPGARLSSARRTFN